MAIVLSVASSILDSRDGTILLLGRRHNKEQSAPRGQKREGTFGIGGVGEGASKV